VFLPTSALITPDWSSSRDHSVWVSQNANHHHQVVAWLVKCVRISNWMYCFAYSHSNLRSKWISLYHLQLALEPYFDDLLEFLLLLLSLTRNLKFSETKLIGTWHLAPLRPIVSLSEGEVKLRRRSLGQSVLVSGHRPQLYYCGETVTESLHRGIQLILEDHWLLWCFHCGVNYSGFLELCTM
jgi:hypothetical protein